MADASTGPKEIYAVGEIPPQFHVPEKMWAWAIRKERHGRPLKAMQLEQVPTPRCGEDEVLVLVMAAGVNYNGVWAGLGTPISPIDQSSPPTSSPSTSPALPPHRRIDPVSPDASQVPPTDQSSFGIPSLLHPPDRI